MNSQIREFFAHFLEVRFLSEEPKLSFEDVMNMGVPRGWYELSRISAHLRVEFTREFWLNQFSFHPKATPAIEDFFASLDDVTLIAWRERNEEPWNCELVYSLADNSTFFRGLVPADEGEIVFAKKKLAHDLPHDFWAFSRLHNGFGRVTLPGIFPLEDLKEARNRLIDMVLRSEKLLKMGEKIIDPRSLFPFFEEYGVDSFQCFNAEWYPGSEMGNVWFSGIDFTLSDTNSRKNWEENLAYPTFLEWLADYLGGVNTCI